MHSVKEMVIVYLILIISLIDFVMVFDAILTSRQRDFGAVTKLHTNLLKFLSRARSPAILSVFFVLRRTKRFFLFGILKVSRFSSFVVKTIPIAHQISPFWHK